MDLFEYADAREAAERRASRQRDPNGAVRRFLAQRCKPSTVTFTSVGVLWREFQRAAGPDRDHVLTASVFSTTLRSLGIARRERSGRAVFNVSLR